MGRAIPTLTLPSREEGTGRLGSAWGSRRSRPAPSPPAPTTGRSPSPTSPPTAQAPEPRAAGAMAATFRDLWDRPAEFRGRWVAVGGRVGRVFHDGPVGQFPPLAEVWVDSPASDPLCLVFPETKADPTPKPGDVVRFEGTFLRRGSPRWRRRPAGPPDRRAGVAPGRAGRAPGVVGIPDWLAVRRDVRPGDRRDRRPGTSPRPISAAPRPGRSSTGPRRISGRACGRAGG